MGVALITPFHEDGTIDFPALARLVEYQIQNGIDYLVVLGTTAETPTLTEEEKAEVRAFVIEKVAGRVPIVLGMGGNNTRAIVEALKTGPFRWRRCHTLGSTLLQQAVAGGNIPAL